MHANPISTTRTINRYEFAALTRPYRARRWGLTATAIVTGTLTMLTPTLAFALLATILAASVIAPNCMWHAEPYGSSNKMTVADAVWPPAPNLPPPNSGLDLSHAGTIRLQTLEISAGGSKLSFKNGPAAKLQNALAALFMPVGLLCFFYRLLGAEIYWGLVVALGIGLISSIRTLRTKPIIVVDRETAQITIDGKHFSATSEVHSIAVVDSPGVVYMTRNRRKPARIVITKAAGTPFYLPNTATIDDPDPNIIAMILGQYVTESR